MCITMLTKSTSMELRWIEMNEQNSTGRSLSRVSSICFDTGHNDCARDKLLNLSANEGGRTDHELIRIHLD